MYPGFVNKVHRASIGGQPLTILASDQGGSTSDTFPNSPASEQMDQYQARSWNNVVYVPPQGYTRGYYRFPRGVSRIYGVWLPIMSCDDFLGNKPNRNILLDGITDSDLDLTTITRANGKEFTLNYVSLGLPGSVFQEWTSPANGTDNDVTPFYWFGSGTQPHDIGSTIYGMRIMFEDDTASILTTDIKCSAPYGANSAYLLID